MHRFFVEKDAIQGDQAIVVGPAARQICDVLRLTQGEKIIILDNTGLEYTVSLDQISRRQVAGRVTTTRQCTNEPKTKITLFQAITSRDKFEHILQKCTEIGVVRFVPVITERSIVRSCDKITDEKMNRRRAIITEAAEQSGRGVIPQLDRPMLLADAAENSVSFDLKIFGSTDETAVPLRQILRKGLMVGQALPNILNVALFIGPEGGFSDAEMHLICVKGLVGFGMGRRILRTETAAVVASSLILYELEN
jgi:16S rRNA (uracil1498-N3)-methyltransferase